MLILKRINTSPKASYVLTVENNLTGDKVYINPSWKCLKHHLDKHNKQIRIIR